MFVEILFPLQSVATDGDAVICCIKNVGVSEFSHFVELCEDAADLGVDVFRAGIIAADFVADGDFVAAFPDTADIHFISDVHVGVVERVGGKPVGRQRRLLGVGGRRGGSVGVVSGAVFGEKCRRAVALVMGMGEAEVDEKWAFVLFCLPLAEVFEHALGVPCAARCRCATAFSGVVNDVVEFVCGGVTVALFARPHGGESGAIEDGAERVFLKIQRTFLRTGADGKMPNRPSTGDHVPRGRANRASEGSHVMGGIQDHAAGCKALDVRGIKRGLRIVEFEIVGRLIVHEDEEDVRPLCRSVTCNREDEGEEESHGITWVRAAGLRDWRRELQPRREEWVANLGHCLACGCADKMADESNVRQLRQSIWNE